MGEEKQFVGVRMVNGEVKVACMAPPPNSPHPAAILMPCALDLYRALNGWWSIYAVQFPSHGPIRLKLAVASERDEMACGQMSRKTIDPSPGVLLLIANSLERSGRGAHGR